MIDNVEWAEKTFGEANLGDPRRTSRLVKLAATLANTPGKPLLNYRALHIRRSIKEVIHHVYC